MSDFSFYIENSEKLSEKALQETLRNIALKDLKDASFPTRKNESWKYTNPKTMLNRNFELLDLKSLTLSKDDSIVNNEFYHFYMDEKSLRHNLDSKDLEIMALCDIKDFSLFENAKETDFTDLLNTINQSKGFLFKLSKNKKLDRPIHIHYHFSSDQKYINMTNFFLTEIGSDLQLLETFESTKEVFVNYTTKSLQLENSKFNHGIIQDLKYGSLFFLNESSNIEKDATAHSNIITLGAKLSRSNLFIDLKAENAECHTNGLYALHRDQHHDTSSYIKHSAPLTFANQLYKGILDDESRGIFTGKVRVDRDSQQIDSKQLNKNLLLSKKAQVNSRPQLEIYADDVKCAHGSTTGQMSEDELFYFESRGITKAKARSILARAFAYDVVLKQENLLIRNEIIKKLVDKDIVKK